MRYDKHYANHHMRESKKKNLSWLRISTDLRESKKKFLYTKQLSRLITQSETSKLALAVSLFKNMVDHYF